MKGCSQPAPEVGSVRWEAASAAYEVLQTPTNRSRGGVRLLWARALPGMPCGLERPPSGLFRLMCHGFITRGARARGGTPTNCAKRPRQRLLLLSLRRLVGPRSGGRLVYAAVALPDPVHLRLRGRLDFLRVLVRQGCRQTPDLTLRRLGQDARGQCFHKGRRSQVDGLQLLARHGGRPSAG